MNRCSWCNLDNDKYVLYHDREWSIPTYDDNKLFEMLLLESFQAGLSWECILNKREYFRESFDNFDYNKISNYDEIKIEDIETAIGTKIYWKIPNNYFSIMDAINKGVTVSEVSQDSNIANSFRDFATKITDDMVENALNTYRNR